MNKRNEAMYHAKRAYSEFLMYARVLSTKQGTMTHRDDSSVWVDVNGYTVTMENCGKIVRAEKPVAVPVPEPVPAAAVPSIVATPEAVAMSRAEAVAQFRACLDSVNARIADLESYFSVTCIDAWPYVVVLDSPYGSRSALKSLGGTHYNFNAQGRDAVQFSRERAEQVAKEVSTADRTCSAMGKREFFKLALESARRTAADFEDLIATAGDNPRLRVRD